jgi:hypothetical protein
MGYTRWSADIGGTGIPIIDCRRRARNAAARSVADLRAIAGIAIRARSAGAQRCVRDAQEGIASVDRAGIEVVDLGRFSIDAGCGFVAQLEAVAFVAVRARGAYFVGREGRARLWIAFV